MECLDDGSGRIGEIFAEHRRDRRFPCAGYPLDAPSASTMQVRVAFVEFVQTPTDAMVVSSASKSFPHFGILNWR